MKKTISVMLILCMCISLFQPMALATDVEINEAPSETITQQMESTPTEPSDAASPEAPAASGTEGEHPVQTVDTPDAPTGETETPDAPTGETDTPDASETEGEHSSQAGDTPDAPTDETETPDASETEGEHSSQAGDTPDVPTEATETPDVSETEGELSQTDEESVYDTLDVGELQMDALSEFALGDELAMGMLMLNPSGRSVIKTGSLGGDVSYTIYDDGYCEISGTGTTNNYSHSNWLSSGNPEWGTVTCVKVGEGITGLGNYLFFSVSNLNKVELPSTIQYFGERCFESGSIAELELPESITSLPNSASFFAVKRLVIPSSVTSIADDALVGVDAIYFRGTEESWNQIFHGTLDSTTAISFESGIPTIDPGTIGSNLIDYGFVGNNGMTWGITQDGALSIVGSGEMQAGDHPWYYEYQDMITSVTIGEGVTGVSANAFKQCTNLTSVLLPSTLTVINASAFEQCANLASVSLPASLTTLGAGAFKQCTGMTSISLPSSLTSIGASAFRETTALKSVNIPAGCAIGDEAFYASGLESLSLPTGCTFGASAFSKCQSLYTVQLPDGLTAISNSAFANSALSSIHIPDSVTELGAGAFSGCKNLKSVNLPEGITTIPERLFYGSGIESIVFPDSVTEISGREAFSSCTSLREIVFPRNLSLQRQTFTSMATLQRIVFPDVMTADIEFDRCGSLTEIVLPASGSIGLEILECGSLRQLNLTEAISSVTVNNCAALSSVSFSGNELKTLKIDGSRALTSIDLPDGLEMICLQDTGVTDLILPDSFIFPHYINRAPNGANLFDGSPITAFHVKETNTRYKEVNGFIYSLDGRMLYLCPMTGVTDYVVPENTEIIGPCAFARTAIKHVTLPSSLTTIQEEAFKYASIISLDIPQNVQEIGMRAFEYSSLRGVRFFCESLDIPAWAFVTCESLTSVELPKTSCTIGNQAFAGCTALTEINLEHVTELGYGAFVKTGLKSVTIPAETEFLTNPGEPSFAVGYTGLFNNDNTAHYDRYLYNVGGKVSGFVIYGYSNSPAQTYAAKSGITFVALDGAEEPTPSDDPNEPDDPETPPDSGESSEQGQEGPGPANQNSTSGGSQGSGSGSEGGEHGGNEGGESTGNTGEQGNDGEEGEGDGNDDGHDDSNSDSQEGSGSGCKVGTEYHTWKQIGDHYVCEVCHATFVTWNHINDTLDYLITGNENDGYRLYIYLRDACDTGEITNFAGRNYSPWSTYSSKIQRVYCPEGLTRIGDYAFYGFSALRGLKLPTSLSSIGEGAFSFSGLNSITLPSNLTRLSAECFDHCAALESVNLTSKITTVPERAFRNCDLLSELILPSTLTLIDSRAFENCVSLKNVQLPAKVNTLQNYVFYGCGGLEEIVLSEALTAIPYQCFFGCVNLTSIELPQSCKSIGKKAFENCVRLNSITIPETVTSISDDAFTNCGNPLQIACHAGTTADTVAAELNIGVRHVHFYYDGVCRVCGELCQHLDEDEDHICDLCGLTLSFSGECGESLRFQLTENESGHKTLTFSGTGAMWNYTEEEPAPWHPFASDINDLRLGDTSQIGDYAFADFTMLNTLELGAQILSIGQRAFSGCTALEELTVHPETITIGTEAFSGCGRLNLLCHPGSAAHSYAVANNLWYMPTHFPDEGGVCSCSDCNVTVGERISTANGSAYQLFTGTDDSGNETAVMNVYGSAGTPNGGNTHNEDKDASYIPWYKQRHKVTGLYLSRNIQRLGSYAFYQFDRITELQLPDHLTSISERAFYHCDALTELVLPRTLTGIADEAFMCSSLTHVELQEGGTVFGGLQYCTNLTELVLPSTLKSISHNPYCTSLQSVTLPEGLEVIGAEAFKNCTALTQIVIPDSVVSIGKDAFYYCTSLESVQPASELSNLTSIGVTAFTGCSKLSAITIPESVTTIGQGAFRSCSALTEITIPGGVTALPDELFRQCSSLTEVHLPDTCTRIGASAFLNCTSLTDIAFPAALKEIGASAFSGCTGITKTSIVIPDGVKLGDSVFSGWPSLSAVYLDGSISYEGSNESFPSSVKSLYAKDMLSWLSCSVTGSKYILSSDSNDRKLYIAGQLVQGELVIPEGVASIPSGAFYNTPITSVQIPDSVTQIGAGAFRKCSSLETVSLPSSLDRIDGYAFDQCKALTSISIPDSVTVLGNNALSWCDNLTEVILPASLISIGDAVFVGDSKLSKITIPETVTTIGKSAFSSCRGLTELTIPEGVTTIGDYAFQQCTGLTEIKIPGSVVNKIGNYAFNGCTALEIVVMEQGVTGWNQYTFQNCPIKSATIPPSVATYSTGYGTAYLKPTETIYVHEGSAADTYFKGQTAYASKLHYIHFYGTDGSCVSCDSQCSHSYTDTVIAPTVWTGGYTQHTCTICGYSYQDSETEPLPNTDIIQIKSATAVLNGTLAIRFTFGIPAEIAADQGACARFTGSGRTVEIPLSQAKLSNGEYSFDYRMAAKEYRDLVNVKLYGGDGQPITVQGSSGKDYTESGIEYSLYTYVTKKLASSSTSDKMRNMANAIDAYCTAAQLYFGYQCEGLTVNEEALSVDASALENYAAQFEGTMPEGVIRRTLQLELVSDTRLRLNIYTDSTIAAENYEFKVNGTRVYPEQNSNGSYYLDVPGIPAKRLDEIQTFSVSYGGETYTVSASALTYARASVLSDKATRQDLGRALYLYSTAANAYFAN